MKKIIAVYNANGGVLGELSYVFGKIAGIKNCELCDITHGYNINGKKEWKDLASNFEMPIETLHINELSESQKNFIGKNTPIVVLEEDNNYTILMNKEDLKKCGKEPSKFFEVLKTRL